MKTYVIINQKGGLGKTTTAISMAAIFQKKGYKTLLIDSDPQKNSTDTYQIDSTEGIATLYDVILEKGSNIVPIQEAIIHTDTGDIIAADELLANADISLSMESDGLFKLKDALESLTGYDYVIIDTSPSRNMLVYNALVAADEIIIPLQADRYSIQGLSKLSETIQAIRKRQNPALKIAGLLLVMYSKRTNLAKTTVPTLENRAQKLGTKLFRTKIRACVKVSEAQSHRQTLFSYAPSCTSAKDYMDFVDELLE